MGRRKASPCPAGFGALSVSPTLQPSRCREAFGRCAWWLGLVWLGIGADASASIGAEESPGTALWDTSYSIREGCGFKDNVLLAGIGAQESAFWLTHLEAYGLRLAPNGAELTFSVAGEDVRFLSVQATRKEQSVLALGQLKKALSAEWAFSCWAQYGYTDQIFDASSLDLALPPVQARGHLLGLHPALTRRWSSGVSLELEGSVSRQYFAPPLDDYWQGGAKLTLRREYGNRSTLSVSYELERRLYDQREEADHDGFLTPGSHLEFQLQKAEFRWQHHWDPARHWRSTLTLGCRRSLDNGSGYFDYRRYSVSGQLRGQFGAWEILAQGSLAAYEYAWQRAGVTEPRRSLVLVASLRAERKLSKHLKLFGEFEHEDSQANEAIDRYRVNTVVGGAEWEF